MWRRQRRLRLHLSLRGAIWILLAVLALKSVNAVPMKNRIEVRLVLYSGKPDPSWTITKPEEIAHIKRLLHQIPEAPDPAWPGLGWRGFLLVAQPAALLPGDVRVFQGVICISDGGTRRCYKDRDKLEDWLRAEAVRQGLGSVLPPP